MGKDNYDTQNTLRRDKGEMMTYTIDRFEDEYAVVELENEDFAKIPKCALPPDADKGDVISVEIDADRAKNRRQYSCNTNSSSKIRSDF